MRLLKFEPEKYRIKVTLSGKVLLPSEYLKKHGLREKDKIDLVIIDDSVYFIVP